MIPSLLVPWVPALTVMLAVAIQNLAFPAQFWTMFRPDVVLLCLFYWRLYRPDRCGPGLAFFSGIATDILSGVAIGLHAFTQIIVILLTGRFGNRLRSADFLFILPLLALLVCMEEGIHWLIMNLFQHMPIYWPLFFGRILATILIAPPVMRFLIHVHRVWLEEERDP